MQNKDVTRYELPPQGITLLGYVARRMHKTALLNDIPALLRESKTAEALEAAARYAVTSSTSFGRAFYQPRFNRVGEAIEEKDPQTGALIRVALVSASPHYHITYTAKMNNGDVFEGEERITGTTLGLRGLGMPAPSKFRFASGDYAAEMSGLLTSELAFSLWGGTKIRAYGSLRCQDNFGNAATIAIDRRQKITFTPTRP